MKRVVAGSIVSSAALYLSSEDRRREVAAKARAIGRIGRLTGTVITMSASYSAQMVKDRLPVVGRNSLEMEYANAMEL